MEFLNKDDKNYYENCYKVTIAATSFLVYANAPDQALELFVADAEINNPHLLYDFDSIRDYVFTTFEDEYREWLSNKSGEEYSYDDSWFDFATEYLDYIYEDATQYGASQPYFVDGSVVSVEETNDEPIVFEDKEPKKEFLDADVNISTGDISSNLDLGGLGALAGLVASEEPKESEEKLEETRIPAQKLIDKYKDTDKVTFKDIKADLDSYSPEASDETIEGLMAQVKAGLEALGFKANETELVKENLSESKEDQPVEKVIADFKFGSNWRAVIIKGEDEDEVKFYDLSASKNKFPQGEDMDNTYSITTLLLHKSDYIDNGTTMYKDYTSRKFILSGEDMKDFFNKLDKIEGINYGKDFNTDDVDKYSAFDKKIRDLSKVKSNDKKYKQVVVTFGCDDCGHKEDRTFDDMFEWQLADLEASDSNNEVGDCPECGSMYYNMKDYKIIEESKSKKEEYYQMPDEENIIWSSEDSIDDYDIDEMKEIYQDYLDEFDSEMKPMTYEDWLFSEECSDYFYYEWVDVAKENPKYAEFYDFITEYVDDEQKEDAYNDYVEQCKNTTLQPDDFETWFDNYRIDHGDEVWSWKEDDLKENIFPAIDKQLNDNVLLLSGSYGSNYPDFRPSGDGGVMWENGTDDFRAYMGNFDSVAITTMNGILGAICGDHDGTVSGQFYTLPDDKTEFIKALGYEDIIKERYDEEDLDKYNENDLMETEFNNDLYYGGIDARDLNQHIDLLKPIKDTISGYAPQDPEGTKTESKLESNESSYKDEFIKYCDGKVQKLSKKVKYPVFNDDEDNKETFEVVMIGNDGNEWLINPSDEDSVVHYWDGTELKLVLPPYGSVSEVLAELDFSAIDKKLYKNTLEYWDELDMDYIFNESRTESKTESKETLTEEKIFLDGVLADKLDKETDLNFDNVDMNSLKVVYGKLEALVEKIYEDRKIDNVEKEITDILSRANVTANSLPTTTTVQEAFNLAQVVRTQVSNKLVDEFGYDVLYEDKKIKTEEYEPNIGSSSYDLGIDFNSYLEENDNVCSLLDYVKFTLATMEADLGPSGLDSFEEVPDFDEILDDIKQDIGQGDITIDDWNKEEAEDYYNDWLDNLSLEESKKIKTEDQEITKYKQYIDDNTKQHLEKLEKDLLAIDGVTGVEYDLAPYADNMKSPIILVHYDQMNTSFKLLKSVVETIENNGLKVEMDELEDNDTYFYIVTYTNNWSKVTESKKLKKENPQQDEAVNSFFNQMDKYMDSKGTDMEALKGIENTANNVYKFRPEFADMRYGDMYRALSKEYVRENKLTEALVRKLNKITETLKKESSINGEWLDKDNVDNYREGTVWVEVDIDPDYIEIDYENEDTNEEWLDKVFKVVQTKATEYDVKVMDLIQAPNGYSVVLKGTLQDIVDFMYDQKNYSIDKCIDDMDIEISREPLQERLLGPSDEVVADSKAKGLYTEDDNEGAKDEIKKDLGIEPGSDEEAQLDSLFDERNELSDKGLATDFKVGDVVKDIVDGDTAIIEAGEDAFDKNYQTGKYLLRFVDGVCKGDAYWYTKGRFELVEDPELEKEAQETYKRLKDTKQESKVEESKEQTIIENIKLENKTFKK